MSERTKIKSRSGEMVSIFGDEILVEMLSALGCFLGKLTMPKKMKSGLVKAYLESGTVNSTYLYINGKEISDGKNHNPLHA